MKRALCLYFPFLTFDRRANSARAFLAIASRAAGFSPRGFPGLELVSVSEEPVHGNGIRSKEEGSVNQAPVVASGETASTELPPAVTVRPEGSTLRVAQVNRAASALGIRAGHTLAHAQALVPRLQSYDEDPAGDRAQLEALALWAQCLSPIVHLEGDDSLFVDVTGCERLFRGERNLLSRAWEGVRGQGFHVRGALADTPGAAWALAHTHPEPLWIATAGRTIAELAPLPVRALRLDPATVKTLKTVGIETIATLLHVPRSSLAGRFGASALTADRAGTR